ncbi:MAG TPA: molybdate ABC transporter substrate-binding protein [Pirellulaceae bacterium]|nr:molybdate ABC transporter substrate-binding protein [Pirellulaceae bacterium]HMP68953.1 molybdate ABC transporter substrate-binding protein [Pirellulaceae bacterium]
MNDFKPPKQTACARTKRTAPLIYAWSLFRPTHTSQFTAFRLLVMWAFVGCVTIGCKPPSPSDDTQTAIRLVSVAAASDLRFALEELIFEFEKEHKDIRIRTTYGSSGNFFAQLSNRAPFDIFFSADANYPLLLCDGALADRGRLLPYAIGQIVVWVPYNSPIDVETLHMDALRHESARKIAIANPLHAPYGRAAEAAMKTLGVYEHVQNNLVVGENIAQAAQFVESGAADIGIIALSLALSPAMQQRGRYWLIPIESYPRMDQVCVIMNWAEDPQATATFQDFVVGPSGREILQKYGFIMPDE